MTREKRDEFRSPTAPNTRRRFATKTPSRENKSDERTMAMTTQESSDEIREKAHWTGQTSQTILRPCPSSVRPITDVSPRTRMGSAEDHCPTNHSSELNTFTITFPDNMRMKSVMTTTRCWFNTSKSGDELICMQTSSQRRLQSLPRRVIDVPFAQLTMAPLKPRKTPAHV